MRSIVHGGGRAVVTSDRLVVEADQVIVALPPVLAARIEYTRRFRAPSACC